LATIFIIAVFTEHIVVAPLVVGLYVITGGGGVAGSSSNSIVEFVDGLFAFFYDGLFAFFYIDIFFFTGKRVHCFLVAVGVDDSLEETVSKRGAATKGVDGFISLLSSIGTSLVGFSSPASLAVWLVWPHGVLATSLGDITFGAVLFLEGLSHLVGFFANSTGISDCVESPLASIGSSTLLVGGHCPAFSRSLRVHGVAAVPSWSTGLDIELIF